MMALNFIFWVLAVPNWTEVLKPQASLLLEYQEIYEKQRDSSSLMMGAKLGVFPEWNQNWNAGIELKLGENSPQAIPDRLILTAGPSNRPISLNQAYVAHRFSKNGVFSLGKFLMPFSSSPLTWDHDLTPEGAYESFLITLSSQSSLKLHAGQFFLGSGIENLAENRKNHRSWTFTEALTWSYASAERFRLELNLQVWNFFNIPEALKTEALQRGAEYVLKDEAFFLKNSKFMPIETSFEISSLPLGILTSLRTAFAINVLDKNKDFGLFGEVRVGRSWVKKNFMGILSFYYNQAMTTLSYFTERDFAYSNRLAGRFELHYYFNESVRLNTSYLLARRAQESLYQDHRHEWRLGVEFKL